MGKIKFLFVFALMLKASIFLAQQVKVDYIIKNDFLQKKERRDFIYLDKTLDVSKSKYIGRIKATSENKNVNISLIWLKSKAQKQGSNSFKFVSFKYENGISEIVCDTYLIDDEMKAANQFLLPKNKLFIFGKDDLTGESEDEYKVNDQSRTIQSFYYVVTEMVLPLTISKGKLLGSSLKIKNNENEASVFINFSGFGAVPTAVGGGGIGISFSGGKVIRMEKDFGLLLTDIFKEQE